MRAANPFVSFIYLAPMSALRAPRRPHLARSLCGAAAIALTLSAPLAAQTAQDITLTYSNGANSRDANPASWGPIPNTGKLTLHVATGAATESVVFPGTQTGPWVKTGSGQLTIAANNSSRFGRSEPASIRVAEGSLIRGSINLNFGKTIATTLQIDAGALSATNASGDDDSYASVNGAGTLAVTTDTDSRLIVSGPSTSTFSGHIGAAQFDNAGIARASTAANRAVGGWVRLGLENGHRLNFSGTTSDVQVFVGNRTADQTVASTLALNGAVLGEIGSLNHFPAAALFVASGHVVLVEGDSRVNSMALNGTADLKNSKLEIFGDNLANAQTTLGSTTVAEGVLKGGAA